jgi:hypothetical protein
MFVLKIRHYAKPQTVSANYFVMRSKIVLLFTILLLTSCDCVVRLKGAVYDSDTREALENVEIRFQDETYYSDNQGYYSVDYVTGFCPELHFIFNKDNYKSFEITIDDKSSSSEYKVRTESKFNDLQRQWEELNSTNFTVRNDSLIVFLTAK